MRKKILYVTHESEINGASKSLISIIKGLNKEYDIFVLIRSRGSLFNELEKLNCKVIIKPYFLDVEPIITDKISSLILWPFRFIRYSMYRNIYNNFIAKQIADYVMDNDISLIHSNSSSTFIGIKIALFAKVPHIWHFREFLKEDFNLRPLLGWNYFYRISSKSNIIICVSNSVVNKYTNHIHTQMCCIYNGVEDNFKLYKKKDHNDINILQAGVLSRGKGTDIAIKAIKYLIDKGYSINLYLAGRGNLEFCNDDYKKIKDYVHLLGFVDMTNIREQYDIDIELVCSKSEAFGRTTIEAMANGNPVIGSDSAGTKELIKNGETGVLYSQGNYIDLANKIENLIKHPELRKSLGDNARHYYEENFKIEKCLREIDKLYYMVLREDSFSD